MKNLMLGATIAAAMLVSGSVLAADCQPRVKEQLTRTPPAGPGNPNVTYPIAGEVECLPAGGSYSVILWSLDGDWWIQPFSNAPLTPIRAGAFATVVHPGWRYAVQVVPAGFKVPAVRKSSEPEAGGEVLAERIFDGARN